MATVTLANVTKTFPPDVVAVKDVSLDIADGEFVVLVGPSGCGKSTTLRLIAGLETCTDGEIHIGGERVNERPPKERDISMVFQNYALYPHMSARANLAFGLTLRRYPKAEIARRVNEAAEILGLTDLLNRRPRALSGGERQRVALGRAIVREPKAFLFDEPLSNLDAKLRVQMRAELSRLHRRLDATIIYVTHDQLEAMTLGHRIAVMRDGLIHQVASPEEVYARPANHFVAGFIGSPPMNFIDGTVEHRDGRPALVATGLVVPLDAVPAAARAPAGETVVLGLRPEHLSLAPSRPAAGVEVIDAVVEVVEPMGAETHVHVRLGPAEWVARVAPDTPVRPDETVPVGLALSHAHLFDPDTGERLGGANP
jgi:multiple sugar transport system ATP-binding protein